jgi:hypothetical protein
MKRICPLYWDRDNVLHRIPNWFIHINRYINFGQTWDWQGRCNIGGITPNTMSHCPRPGRHGPVNRQKGPNRPLPNKAFPCPKASWKFW